MLFGNFGKLKMLKVVHGKLPGDQKVVHLDGVKVFFRGHLSEGRGIKVKKTFFGVDLRAEG